MTLLFCESHPELKLGPGRLSDDQVIWFREGFAEIKNDDPDYAEKMRWVTAGGTPQIEVLGDDDGGRARANDPTALVCPKCGKTFQKQFGLNGHLRSHAPKGMG